MASTLLDPEIRDRKCVEYVLLQFSCQFCGTQACVTITINDLFCPTILQAMRTLIFWRDLAQLEAFPRIREHEASVLILRQMDYADDCVANQQLMRLCLGYF